jgi:hypothetical protein
VSAGDGVFGFAGAVGGGAGAWPVVGCVFEPGVCADDVETIRTAATATIATHDARRILLMRCS